MYKPIFSPAAVSCLVDGRDPNPAEIDEMASKIWDDIYARSSEIAWDQVDRGSQLYRNVTVAALVSLGAMAMVGLEMPHPAL